MWIEILGLIILYNIVVNVYRLFRKQDLTGKTVLVTGAGSGLGKRLSLEFAKRKCKVIASDINEAALEKVAFEIKQQGGTPFTYRCNVGDFKEVMQMSEKIAKDVGQVDILVNNAGIVSGKSLIELNEEMITRTLAVNTLSHLWTFKAFLPQMMERKSGHIVNIVSAAGISGTSGLVDYSASKFGAFGAHEALRMEIYGKGLGNQIHMTAVCPFFFKSGMFEGVQSPSPLLPILEESYVGDRVIYGIEHFEDYVVMPSMVWVTFVARVLPVWFQNIAMSWLGLTSVMHDFKGRGWNVTDPTQGKKSQ